MPILLCLIFLLFSSATADCEHCVHQTKVSFFSKAEALQCKNHFFPLITYNFSVELYLLI